MLAFSLFVWNGFIFGTGDNLVLLFVFGFVVFYCFGGRSLGCRFSGYRISWRNGGRLGLRFNWRLSLRRFGRAFFSGRFFRASSRVGGRFGLGGCRLGGSLGGRTTFDRRFGCGFRWRGRSGFGPQ